MTGLSARNDQGTGATSLIDLPFDILLTICEFLCLHCQDPHVAIQGREVILAAWEDQRALARLARTCRSLRDIAQPVLFHWYHSGCIPEKLNLEGWEGEWEWERDDGTDDQLIPFLRAAVGRPALAAAVRAFTMLSVDYKRTYTEANASIGRHLARTTGIEDDEDPGLGDNWFDRMAPFVFPNLTQCFVLCMPGSSVFYCLRKCPARLARLTYLALIPWARVGSYHLFETSNFLACLPSLEVLIAPDCGADTDWDLRALRKDATSWDLRLDRLRVLSISHLSPEFICSFLQCCPALEDFEFYRDQVHNEPLLSPRNLASVQDTLRRLCYSITPPYIQDGHWNDDLDDLDELGDGEREQEREQEQEHDLADHLSWQFMPELEDVTPDTLAQISAGLFDASVFPRLEILEIEQILLYGGIFRREIRAAMFALSAASGPETFISHLPPSLRVLHIGMAVAWPELRRDLAGLAAVAPARFPHLHTVRIDTFQDQYHPPLPADEVQEMASLLGGIGVAFSAGPTPESSAPRGMLGPRPGRPEAWHTPAILYGLDGKMCSS